MYNKNTKHNASSSSSTQPHRGDQDQISRTMGLFSMTNLRHMLVHRYASLLGRTHTHTHTHTVPRSLTHITRGGRQCSVPCINGSCARMTNSWPFIQMPRFRIIAPSSRRLTHSHARCRKQTHLAEPIEASQHR